MTMHLQTNLSLRVDAQSALTLHPFCWLNFVRLFRRLSPETLRLSGLWKVAEHNRDNHAILASVGSYFLCVPAYPHSVV
jgi:hypothetical protein